MHLPLAAHIFVTLVHLVHIRIERCILHSLITGRIEAIIPKPWPLQMETRVTDPPSYIERQLLSK